MANELAVCCAVAYDYPGKEMYISYLILWKVSVQQSLLKHLTFPTN